jgi:hypothetical protein
MATTAIWAINGNISGVLTYVENKDKTRSQEWSQSELQGLKDVMDYAVNPSKTEKQFYVTGINCDPSIAREQMLITKRRFGKLEGRSAYHGYQSFKPGETTPDIAHEIGVKFAQMLWGYEYQVIVATHTDRAHIHNHFVINSVSFVDGRKYHSDCQSYFGKMRSISDTLCREYGLSVVEPTDHDGSKTRHYKEWLDEKDGRQTWRGIICQDVDSAILQSATWSQFLSALKAKGYEIKTGMHIAVRPPGKERFIRLRSLGDEYTQEALMRRISQRRTSQNDQSEPRKMSEQRHLRGSIRKKTGFIRLKGFRALYFQYMYRMGIVKRHPQSSKRMHFLLREDLLKLDMITTEFKLLHANRIDTISELKAFRDKISTQVGSLLTERREIGVRKRKATDQQEFATLMVSGAAILLQLKECRKELKLCDDIEQRSIAMANRLKQIEKEKENTKHAKSKSVRNQERG